jgi:hypothetical protein
MMPQILKGKDPQEMIWTMFKMIVAFGAVGVAVVINWPDRFGTECKGGEEEEGPASLQTL